ncbi:FUSC family protein [Streptomyces sp. 7R007]
MTRTRVLDAGRPQRRPAPRPVRELLVLHPMPSRRRSATIAAVCTAAPVLLGQALAQPALGLVATTGALSALYGGRGTPRQEAGAVAAAALSLATGMAIGSCLAGHDRLAVLGTALWAAVTALLCALARARPPGIVMPVLVCSVGTGLPPGHTVDRVAAVAAVGLAATALSWLAATVRTAGTDRPPAADHGMARRRLLSAVTSLPSSPLPWMAVRTGAAVGLAGTASLVCQVGRPYWATAAAAAVLARGSHALSANTRAVLRGAGTALGCLLAGALAAAHPRGVTIALLLALLTFVIELVVARNYAVAMVFVTPLSVLLVTSATGATRVLLITADRLLETVLGCAAATVAGQLVSRRWAVRHRRAAVAAVLTSTAELLEAGPGPRTTTALRDAVALLRLVSERTAGERRGVRRAAATLDEVADAALALADRVAAQPDGPGADTADTARALRLLASRTDPCGPADSHAEAVPPPPAALERAPHRARSPVERHGTVSRGRGRPGEAGRGR